MRRLVNLILATILVTTCSGCFWDHGGEGYGEHDRGVYGGQDRGEHGDQNRDEHEERH